MPKPRTMGAIYQFPVIDDWEVEFLCAVYQGACADVRHEMLDVWNGLVFGPDGDVPLGRIEE